MCKYICVHIHRMYGDVGVIPRMYTHIHRMYGDVGESGGLPSTCILLLI